MREISPDRIAPSFARYAQGVEVPEGMRLIVTSGQLGLSEDGTIPDGAEAQAALCLRNIDAILGAAGADRSNVVRLNAYVTAREHMAGYMAARDAWLGNVTRLPASTLMIVSGFTLPNFVVEIEALAAAPATVNDG